MTIERCEFPNDDGLQLVADHYPADTAAVVIMANDIFTHRRWRDRYPFIAEKLNARGIAAFAFDYAGCGESADTVLRPESMMGDLRAAVVEVRAMGYQRVALWGHGLGSSMCIDACVPDIRTIVLSGAGTAGISYDWETELGAEMLAKLKADGVVALPSYDPQMRPQQTIDWSLLKNLLAIDQEELLGKLRVPVLLINGNDPKNVRECERLEANRRGFHLLPRGSEIAVIEGAGHSFAGHFDELADHGARWLSAHLA